MCLVERAGLFIYFIYLKFYDKCGVGSFILWIYTDSFSLQSIMTVKFLSTSQNRNNDVPIQNAQKKKKKEKTQANRL